MYTAATPQQQVKPATKKLVTRLVLNLVDRWVDEGLVFPEVSYKELFACILPGYSMGSIHAKMIGEALVIIEDIHQIKIETVLPLLRQRQNLGEWQSNQ